MHDSLTPLGGMVPMVLMMLNAVFWRVKGVGLMNMLIYVMLTVFICSFDDWENTKLFRNED